MTTTACDDQFAPDPSSREAAIEAMVMEVQPHEWRQGGAMRYQGHLITWGEYVQRRRVMTEGWHKAQDDLADMWDEGEARIDRIAQSDASGAHYGHSKYHREIKPGVWVDVYDVLRAWGVKNPSLQHLIKKALAPGERGHKTLEQDMNDIVASAKRAKELES